MEIQEEGNKTHLDIMQNFIGKLTDFCQNQKFQITNYCYQ